MTDTNNKTLLDLCLSITGAFENGTPRYDGVSGNSDGMGISVGIIQWNAGQGTLQDLLQRIAAKAGWSKLQSFFISNIQEFASLSPKDAVQFCIEHYIESGSNRVAPAALQAWEKLLSLPESIETQVEMATDQYLKPALNKAALYCPNSANRTRVVSFFFDETVQEGSMQDIEPLAEADQSQLFEALDFASLHAPHTTEKWRSTANTDSLAALLLCYGYARAKKARPEYMWDAFSRRGTIACRYGWVHGQEFDFTTKLD